MQGFVVERKAGWDCHGLPVEREVEKKLGLSTFEEIKSFGLENFNQMCAESVWQYLAEWERLTKRMGYWTDLDNRYATLDLEYMEAEWWALKKLWQKGLLKRGYKVLPYSPKTGCTYSNRDVAEGYRVVTDLTCFVRFPLLSGAPPLSCDGPVSMLVWTSTPWSLPGNVLLAVHKDLTYYCVRVNRTGPKRETAEKERGTSCASFEAGTSYFNEGEVLCVAETLLSKLEGTLLKGGAFSWKVVAQLQGSDLLGARYSPPMSSATEGHSQLWQVVHGDFVNSKEGTGVVHVAPMYGEDDHRLCVSLGLDLSLPECQHVVGEQGRFLDTSQVPKPLQGLDVTCDMTQVRVLELLHQSGSLCRGEPLTHNYPHCWRNKSHRLLRYAMESWFVTMADPTVRSRMQQLNSNEVQFAPEKVKEGRFGGWLRESRDWCVSRKRTWGCPLPVWVCRREKGGCGAEHCVGSRAELRSLLVDESAPLDDLHTTHVDSLVLRCSSCFSEAAMTREPYVLDCWFDSGCAPFAQQYGKGNTDHPLVDFVAEGQDQCRGWFFSLLALSTTLFDRAAYKKCLVLGLLLDKDGHKMSKSVGNVVDPWHHFNEEGADAVRWYLLGMCAPWADRRFDAQKVRSANQKFFNVLFNVSKFWHSQRKAVSPSSCSELEMSSSCSRPGALDRWVLSRLARLVETCNDCFERDQFHVAVSALEQFVSEDLSKTYVRLSRSHFSHDPSPVVLGLDQADAVGVSQEATMMGCLQTMRTVLLYVCRLTAPMAPFMVDFVHRSLLESVAGFSSPNHSVHLAPWPTTADVTNWHDPVVEEQMGWLLELMEAGRVLHAKGNRPGRLPLAKAFVSLPPRETPSAPATATAYAELAMMLAYELNVQKVEVLNQEQFAQVLQEVQVQKLSPNLGKLGSRFKGEMNEVLEALASKFGEPTVVGGKDKEPPALEPVANDNNPDTAEPNNKKSKKKATKKAKQKKSPGSTGGWEGLEVEKALKLLQTGQPLELMTSTRNHHHSLFLEDFHLSQQPRDGYAVAYGSTNLVLDLAVKPELESTYLVKELVHFVHQVRKSLDKERLLQGKPALERVQVRVVVVQQRKQDVAERTANPVVLLSEREWSRVLEATMADPEKSFLVQQPSNEVLRQCAEGVNNGLMLSMEVRGYGCCGGFSVFVQCDSSDDVDAKERASFV